MEKFYSKLSCLLTAILLVGFGQVGISQALVEISYTGGAFQNEDGWQLVDVTTNTLVECYATGTTGDFTMQATVTNGNSFELRTWESFGDGYNGSNLRLTNIFDGFDYYNQVPPTSGNGTVACGSPSSGGQVVWSGTISATPPDCNLTCPDDLTVSASDPFQCGGFVNIPLPSLTGTACASKASIDNGFQEMTCQSLANTDYTISNAPAAAAGATAMITVTRRGDVDFFTELDDIFVEGIFLGRSADPPFGAQCSNDGAVDVFTLDAADLATVLADGQLDFVLDPVGTGKSCTLCNLPSGFANDVLIEVVYATPGAPTAINDYNGTSDASDFYPVGTTTVTFTANDLNCNPIECSFDVTVLDDAVSELNCPDDITVNLDAGECGQVLNFGVTARDGCGFDCGDDATLTTPCQDVFRQNGAQFDLNNLSANTLIVSSLEVNLNADGFYPSTALIEVYIITGGGSYTTGVGNPGAYTLVASQSVTANGTCEYATVDVTPFEIAPGATQGVYVRNATGSPFATPFVSATQSTASISDGTLELEPGALSAFPFDAIFGGFRFDGSVTYGQLSTFADLNGECSSAFEKLDNTGLGSGDLFHKDGSPYTLSYRVTDANGNTAECSFDIIVNEFPNPIGQLACNDLIQLSLDDNCEATVGADLVLEGGPYGCYDDYIVELEVAGVARPSGLLTGSDIGEEIYARVTDPDTGNKCWGRIQLEDKKPPVLDCPPATIACSGDLTPGAPTALSLSLEPNETLPEDIDVGGFTYTFDLAGAPTDYTGGDLDVRFDCDHLWVGLLQATLTAPDGTQVEIFDNPAGDVVFPPFGCMDDNYDNVLFDDDAANAPLDEANDSFCDGSNPAITGSYQPIGSFSDFFNGSDLNGTWTLQLDQTADIFGAPDGTLRELSLELVVEATLTDQSDFSDNCGIASATFSDERTDVNCGDDIVTRTWTVTDLSGNVSTCDQIITLQRASIEDLVAPPNYDGLDEPSLICDEKCPPLADRPACYPGPDPVILGWNVLEQGPYAGNPSPYNDMWPCDSDAVRCFGTGEPGGVFCGDINATFEDLRIPICTGGGASEGCYKILRKWTLLDWCTGEVSTYNQIIKVEDLEGPSIKDLDDLTISTEVWACSADFTLPTPWIDDNCSDIAGYTVAAPDAANLSFNGTDWTLNDAPLGVYDITVTAADCCGNETDTIITITVEDATPPVAVCDQSTVVSLTTTSGIDDDNIGLSKVFASTFDDGSFDNCGPVFFKVIKMDELNNTPNGFTGPFNPGLECIGDDGIAANGDDDLRIFRPGTQVYFDDFVKFCCEDIGETHMVVFRVFDRDPDAFALPANLTTEGTTGAIDPAAMSNPFALGGHFTDCMVEITVQDKVPPYIEAPSDLTVTCEYWFDLDAIGDLSNTQFGTVRDDQNARDSIIIYDRYCGDNTADSDDDGSNDPMFPYVNNDNFDPENPLDKYRKSVGIDGYAIDNCGVDVNVTVIPNINCGQGTVTRVFTATDPEGRTSSDIQRITIIDCEPFFINDTNCFNFDQNDGVIWPCDRDLFGCTDDTSPDNTGRPQLFEDQCDQVAATFEDQTFIFEDSACLKIIRKWTVIDWCQFDDNDTDLNDEFDVTDDGQIEGYWQYIQEIKVRNLQAPVFSPCEDITICAYEDNCTAITDQLLAPVTDDCTDFEDLVIDYKIDAFNDGIYDFSGTGNDANNATLFVPGLNGAFPIGTHRILFSAADRCDNIGTCEFLFTVEDCLEPKAICLNGIATVTIGQDDCIEIWASEFNFGSEDNCTDADDLIFSFSDDLDDTAIEVCCDDPNYDVTVPVDIYVTDEAGNTAICETYMLVTGCDNNSTASISGGIENEDGEGVEDVMVDLESPAPGIPDFQVTGVDGAFSFTGLPLGYDYTVAPEKDINPLNGVSTFDLVLISKHILGSELLSSPYKMIAADVNRSGSISTFDIVQLRKLILFIDTEFQNNTSWRFVPGDFIFGSANPFASAFPEVYDIAGLNADQIAEFVAIKTGDVNGSANPNALVGSSSRNAVDNLVFTTADQDLVAGQEVEVSFTAAQLKDVLGYQFTLNLDTDMVEFVNVEAGNVPGLTGANFGQVKEGVITTSWNTDRAQDIADDQVIFTLTLRAKQGGQLSDAVSVSSDFTVAEGYNTDLDFLNIDLEFTSEIGTAANFALYQNTPNPFKDETLISFNLPEANEATLTIYDVAGRTLQVITGDYAKGYNEVSINRSDLSGAGVLYYRLDSGDDSQVKKMIIIE